MKALLEIDTVRRMAQLWQSRTQRASLAKSLVLAGAVFACTVQSNPARAHLLPVGNASLNIIDQKAYLAMSLPVDVFASIESCNDGVLTTKELSRDRERIVEAVHRGLTIKGNTQASLSSVLLNLPTQYSDNADESEEILVMVVAHLGEHDDVELRWLHWSEELEVLHLRAAHSKGKKLLSAQYAELTESRPGVLIVKRPLQASLRWLKRRVQELATSSPVVRVFR